MATDVIRNLFKNPVFGDGTSGVTTTGGVQTSITHYADGRPALLIAASASGGTAVFNFEETVSSELTVIFEALLGGGDATGTTVSVGGSSFEIFPENMQPQAVEYKAAFTEVASSTNSVSLTFPPGAAGSIVFLDRLTVVPALYYGTAFSGDSIHSIWEGEPDKSASIQNPGHNSPTSWWVNNIPLNSYAMSIETIGDDKSSVPATRQSSTVIPFRPGNLWHEGVTDVRTQQLGLWLLGAEADGTVPRKESARVKFQDNLREIQRRIWDPGKLVELKKKIWVRTSELEEAEYPKGRYLDYGKMSLVTLYNDNASFSNGLAPSMTGGARATMVMNFTLHDPFYYGVRQSKQLSAGTNTIYVPGDTKTRRVYLKATYGSTTDGLTITINGREFKIPTNTLTGGSLSVDSLNFTAIMGSSNYNAEPKITNTGSDFWLELDPGVNTVTMSAPSGATVTLEYESCWF